MRVLFFAQLKDATKCDSVELHLPSPLNTEQLWAQLLKQFPALANHRKSVRFARNAEYAASDAQFFDADEVAVIPPVSGG
jgi:molybdopterin converting factor subunit 1